MAGKRPVVQLQIKQALQSKEADRQRKRERAMIRGQLLNESERCYTSKASNYQTRPQHSLTNDLSVTLYFAVSNQNMNCPNTPGLCFFSIQLSSKCSWSCAENRNWILVGVEAPAVIVPSSYPVHSQRCKSTIHYMEPIYYVCLLKRLTLIWKQVSASLW